MNLCRHLLLAVVTSASLYTVQAFAAVPFLDVSVGARNLGRITLFDSQANIAKLDDIQLARFETVAREQAKVWADTILEGDYRSSGETQLDRVELLFDGATSEPRAYRITYSEKAWFVGDCDPRAGFAECEEGKIVEATYVSPDSASFSRDEQALANFTTSL